MKIAALLLGIAFTFGVRNRLLAKDALAPALMRGMAVLSIGIWFTVAAAGRWIGFSGLKPSAGEVVDLPTQVRLGIR